VLVKKCFDPLTKFKVVLVLCIFQFAHVDVALDAILVKSCLQNLVVFYELMLVFGLPFDTAEREGVWVQAVHDSAVNCSRRALLNLLHAKLTWK